MAEVDRLGAIKNDDSRPVIIRPLNADEMQAFTAFSAQAVRARNCFRICRIVHQNFAEWDRHIRRLLQPQHLLDE
jgi:hypothetical protein